MSLRHSFVPLLLLFSFAPLTARADNGSQAWLRYAALDEATARRQQTTLPGVVVSLGTEPLIQSAQRELMRGVRGLLGRTLRIEPRLSGESAILVGTLAQIRQGAPQLAPAGANLLTDAFWLKTVTANGVRHLIITGENDRGVLYGTFAYLRRLALGEPLADLDVKETPAAPIRWVNEWNNLDGTIERGYAGRSIFWENGRAREDLARVGEYGRLLASLGINGISINNVNANPRVLAPEMVQDIARIATAFRPWGVRVAIAIDFGSPQTLGKLESYDPLDPAVIAWWKGRADDLYKAIPDFAGFVLKADSEGRVGPSTYGRTHADAANVVARALKPHGGVIFYRGFVYDHHMDWNNPKNDRARAAVDNFKPLDGAFDDNVIVQIKNGPIDFQVREPASPLFGALEKTNEVIELQITQEYFGQARHTVFLPPMWKETLDFDLRVKGAATPTPVKTVVAGKVFNRPLGGFVGVSNVGLDENWTANHLSQANLYGFGRLAWNPDLTSRQIADEWTKLTFGSDPAVIQTIASIQLSSWRTFENYTGPLGLQTLTDIVGNHYGVAVEASERNGWGQWHNADQKGVGMDRTVATGTGFAGQFRPDVAKMYETLEACPDELLLFMHHVPYAYKLKSGKTVIQYLYDTHYEGADAVEAYAREWAGLKGKIDDERYNAVLAQLKYQSSQAIVWRDAVTMWFFKASSIADAKGRVGTFPGRMEAEAASLTGYVATPVTPWETASGGTAIECKAASCTATFKYTGEAGWRELAVQYFDTNTGVARFRVRVGDQIVDEWTAADRIPTRKPDGSSSSRRIISGVALRPGDEIKIEGIPDAGETAALDYIEIRR